MNPTTTLELHLQRVLLQWLIIIAVAWLVGRAGKRLGQPLVLGEIVGGLLLGPSAFGALWPRAFAAVFPADTQQSLHLLAQIGLILLLFQVGMEFDFGHFRKASKAVLAISFSGLVVPVAGALAIGWWLHREFAADTRVLGFQLFVCIAMAITALPVMARILVEMNLTRTPLGVIAISAAAMEDVVGWVGLGAITALVSANFRWPALVLQIAEIGLFLLILVKVVGPAVCALWRRWHPASETPARMLPQFMAIVLIALFTSCYVTIELGIFAIFGAFALGVSLHEQRDLVSAWRYRFEDFVLVALAPVFFTSTGLRTEVGLLSNTTALIGCAVVVLVAAAGKLGGCFVAARLVGLPTRMAGSVAALMNTRGLMELVAINVGADLGFLPPQLFTIFVLMALITTAMTGPLLRWWLPAEIEAERLGLA